MAETEKEVLEREANQAFGRILRNASIAIAAIALAVPATIVALKWTPGATPVVEPVDKIQGLAAEVAAQETGVADMKLLACNYAGLVYAIDNDTEREQRLATGSTLSLQQALLFTGELGKPWPISERYPSLANWISDELKAIAPDPVISTPELVAEFRGVLQSAGKHCLEAAK